jgi:hypothetical protein
MTGPETYVVEARSSRRETILVAGIIAAVLTVSGYVVSQRQVDFDTQRIFDWQISAFYDFSAADQAIYNALAVAADELWWIHGDLLYFGTEEDKADPWPSAEALDQDYAMPPFVKDLAWQQQGRVDWQKVASFSFEGSTVYHGSGGTIPGQSAYLIMLSHVHKGASYADGSTIWVHSDANAPPPSIIKRDSLIIHGWREVVPYSGAMEVERLRGS